MAQPERARPARHCRGSQPPPAPRCGQGPGPGAGGCFPLGLGLGPAAGCTKAGLCAGEARRSVRGLEANAATSSPRCNYSHALPTSISTPRWLLAPLATPGFLLVALGCRLHPAALRAPGRPGLDVQRLRAAAAEQVSGGDTGRDGAPTGKETKGQEGPRPSPVLLAPHLCSSSCSEPSSARAGQEPPARAVGAPVAGGQPAGPRCHGWRWQQAAWVPGSSPRRALPQEDGAALAQPTDCV